MKKRAIQISIEKPCNMVFEEMPIIKGEHHCGKCDKQIIDFSNQSDRAIIAAFKANNSQICGRFSVNQLNRDILLEPSFYQNTRWKAYGLMLSSLLSVGALKGQVISNQVEHSIEEVRKKVDNRNRLKSPLSFIVFEGIVTDNNNQPIADVVLTTNLATNVKTDSLGRFLFRFEKAIQEETVVIRLEKKGFRTKFNVISRENYSKANSLKIILNKEENSTFVADLDNRFDDSNTNDINHYEPYMLGVPAIKFRSKKASNEKQVIAYRLKSALEQKDFVLKSIKEIVSDKRLELTFESKILFDGIAIFRTIEGEEITFKPVKMKVGEYSVIMPSVYLKELSSFKLELMLADETVLAVFKAERTLY